MKRHFSSAVVLWLVSVSLAGALSDSSVTPPVRIVRTALEHLTVLEYDEAVVQAAVGSSAFEVERQDNKVFVRPLKAGASTNLFVWTAAHGHFSYELAVGDVANMDAEIHTGTSKPAPEPASSSQIGQSADRALSQTLTQGERVDSSAIKSPKGKIAIRFEEVLHTDNAVFIRYCLENNSSYAYQPPSPVLYQISAEHPRTNLVSLRYKQIASTPIGKIEPGKQVTISPNLGRVDSEAIAPGGRKQGVIVVPKHEGLPSPAILQLVFGDDVKAMMVL